VTCSLAPDTVDQDCHRAHVEAEEPLHRQPDGVAHLPSPRHEVCPGPGDDPELDLDAFGPDAHGDRWSGEGGSPLLGVKGAVIITHGRARRRMIGFACAVAADTARTGVPQLIADSLRADATRVAVPPGAPGGPRASTGSEPAAAPEPVGAEPGAPA
jgi:hypothetical protein